MKKKDEKHIGLRINADLHAKIFYIAKSEGRTGNGQFIYLIRKCIENYEAEHGKITQEDIDNQN